MDPSKEKNIFIPGKQENVISNYAYYPVFIGTNSQNRDYLKKVLEINGIFARKYFFPITNEFSQIKVKYRGNTPVSLEQSEKVLTLPLYTDLSLEDVNHICDVILNTKWKK